MRILADCCRLRSINIRKDIDIAAAWSQDKEVLYFLRREYFDESE